MRSKRKRNRQEVSMIIAFFTMIFVTIISCAFIGILFFIISANSPVMASEVVSVITMEDNLMLNERDNESQSQQNIDTKDRYVSLGIFRLTAYCPCRKCNGKWRDKPTYCGAIAVPGTTIAVDKNIIPIGETVRINGHDYIAQDTGSAIKGNRIDIFMTSHEDAKKFGVRYAEVEVLVD
jgi:Uncharacterized protein conserved in bacteria